MSENSKNLHLSMFSRSHRPQRNFACLFYIRIYRRSTAIYPRRHIKMSGGKHRPPLILGMYIDLRVKSRDLCAFPYEYRDYVDGRFGSDLCVGEYNAERSAQDGLGVS
mgnify:CR=1 FL=1